MNVETGAEAAQFQEKEYINGIAVAVCRRSSLYWRERGGGQGGRGAQSYYREKAWAAINSLILSGPYDSMILCHPFHKQFVISLL